MPSTPPFPHAFPCVSPEQRRRNMLNPAGATSSLGGVGAQREAHRENGGDGGAGHELDGVVGLWERRVEENGAHLGREVDGAEPLDALREGAVGLVSEELAILRRLLEVVRGDGGEEGPGREGTREATARPRGDDREREGGRGEDEHSSAYLTLTGSSRFLGARLTRDLATPSATRPGHERGLLRTSSGRERAQTSALRAAADPKEPIRAARCAP